MKYTLDKWTAEYFKRIDLSSVPTLEINETDGKVYVSVNDDNVEDLEDEFTTQIVLKGLTDDQEHCTEFGKKLYQIYDDMIAQASEYFKNLENKEDKDNG